MSLQVIAFSKDRPLQLHGYLTSFFKHCQEPETTVKVLVNTGPIWFEEAYAQLQAEFPQVEWCREHDFRTDLDRLVGDPDYTMFGVDDVVFTREWDVGDAFAHPDLLGLSLRLGKHTTRNMFGQPLAQPEFDDCWWRIDGSQGDWGYPWEVAATVYQTEFAQRMVARVQANSPSQLEERGARCWDRETPKRTMAMWQQSRMVVPTVNIVQQEFPNGICGEVPLDTGYLLECWNHGMRLDVDRYTDMTPASWRIGEFFLRRA